MHVAFSAAAGRVANKERRIESRRTAAHPLFDLDCRLNRGPQIFDALDQIVHVDIVRMNVDVFEALDEQPWSSRAAKAFGSFSR
jgi:hypothetical protein